MRYLVEQQKAVKEGIKCGAEEKPEKKGGQKGSAEWEKAAGQLQLFCTYNFFALLEKCNYRGEWPFVFLCIFNELTQHMQATGTCNGWLT